MKRNKEGTGMNRNEEERGKREGGKRNKEGRDGRGIKRNEGKRNEE